MPSIINIMPRNRISDEDKRRIIESHTNGDDYVETARLLGVKRTTAWGIVRRNQQQVQANQANRPRGGARNRKVDQEMTNNMVATIEQHPEYTLAQINAQLHAELPDKPQISDSTVAKTLKTN